MATRAYNKVARAETEERTRAAIQDAAEAAFFDSSFDQVTLADVARRAGTTKQTLLRHFGSKEGLAETCFARATERIAAQRMAAPTDDIEGAVENLLDHYEEVGGKALAMAGMPAGPIVADMLARAKQFHYDWVEHAFGRWLDRAAPRERRRLHDALIALCDVQAWAILAHDRERPRAEVRDTLVFAIRRLIGETP